MRKMIKIAVVLFLITGCSTQPEKEVQETLLPDATESVDQQVQDQFIDYLDQQFIEYVNSSPVSYHFTLRDPSAFDIEKPELTLGEISLEAFKEYEEFLAEELEELKKIDRSKLDLDNQRYYDIYQRYLEDEYLLSQYPQNPNYFSAYTGIQENLIVIFTEWAFYKEEDVDDYLVLLEDVDRYMDDLILFAQVQIDDGYWRPKFIIESTIDSIDRFIEKEEDNALLVSFEERLEDVAVSNAGDLKERHKKIVLNEVLPAYEKLKDFLEENKSIYEGTGAALEYPDGKAYYEALVRRKTGTLKTPEELVKLSESYMREVIINLRSNFTPDEISTYFASDFEIPSAEEILESLQGNVTQDYPEGPEVRYTASYLDSSIANESVIAYYLIPPVDAIEDNVIRINGDYDGEYFSFFNTLAHEGFPGHLYQTTYLFNQEMHPMMYQVSYSGYTEGWAMMAGAQAMNWLPEDRVNLGLIANEMDGVGYIDGVLLDIRVNYFGWTLEDMEKEYGVAKEELQFSYEYSIEVQGELLPYGIGLMMFDTLEKEARKELKDSFNLVEYNRTLLNYGMRSFEEVKKDVDHYVQQNK